MQILSLPNISTISPAMFDTYLPYSIEFYAKKCINYNFLFYFFLIKSNLIIQLLEMYEFKKFDEVVKKKGYSTERLHWISENYKNRH